MDVVETELLPRAFRAVFIERVTIVGLKVVSPCAAGFARVRIWLEPGDPERSNAVEAPMHLWNVGLDPKIEVPARSEVVVEVTGVEVQKIVLLTKAAG